MCIFCSPLYLNNGGYPSLELPWHIYFTCDLHFCILASAEAQSWFWHSAHWWSLSVQRGRGPSTARVRSREGIVDWWQCYTCTGMLTLLCRFIEWILICILYVITSQAWRLFNPVLHLLSRWSLWGIRSNCLLLCSAKGQKRCCWKGQCLKDSNRQDTFAYLCKINRWYITLWDALY